MWHRLLLALVLSVPATASADAIMPFDGECFPGSRRGVSNHREACIPIECTDDAACGEGASCQTLCTCRAEREFRSNGRVIYAEPRREVVEIGLCDAQGACAEGDVASRNQCEPVAGTQGFDPALHRWTGMPHRETEGGEAQDDAPAAQDDVAPGEAAPSGGSCAGCAVPGQWRPRPAWALALLAMMLVLGRRRRRRR